MTRVLHIARISNVNRVMFVDRNERERGHLIILLETPLFWKVVLTLTLKDLKNKKDKATLGAR